MEEENRKYSGLTAYERKRMILKELKETNGGSGSSARETRPGSSNKAMSSTPSESKQYQAKHNKKGTTPSSAQKSKGAPKKKAVRKEWNFDVEIRTEDKDEVEHFDTIAQES